MRVVLILLAVLVMPLGGSQAQEAPCGPERAGLVACVAGKLCACRLERGSAATGLPDGYRWDCGALRPSCGEGLPPATLDPYPYPLPPALGLDLEIDASTVTGRRDRVHNGGGGGRR